MSIFFDFVVGERGRRFRRAVDADKNEVSLLAKHRHTAKIFGNVTIGALIELSTLAIVMINESNKVLGFMALHDCPNIPAVDPADWEMWIRNMFQRYYLSRNTLFVHYMCCEESMADVFVEEAWTSVFQNDEYLLQIALVVPPNCKSDDFAFYQTLRKCSINRFNTKRLDDVNKKHLMYVAQRKDFYHKLVIRRAVEEDNDDIVEILDKLCPRLRDLYGDYYISEIVGRHPDSTRAVIVAQMQDKAIGVMCLNHKVDYPYLMKTYELVPYFGLRKPTGLEKEQLKRTRNNPSQAFSDPILLGKRSPFDHIENLAPSVKADTSKQKGKPPRKSSGRVNFDVDAAMRRSFEHLYFHTQTSDDFSEQAFMTSPDPSLISMIPQEVLLLDEDPFDYDIVNIDVDLLAVPEASPSVNKFVMDNRFDYNKSSASQKLQSSCNRELSICEADKADYAEVVYQGDPNAFIIELYALRDDIDERKGYDLLEAAFEIMKDFDYCLMRVPCNNKPTYLLRHFCFVPVKGDISTDYALYIAHRNSVLGKLRVRKAEVIDVPHIVQLMQNLDGKQTMWLVENSILGKKQLESYVLLSGTSLVGFGILEPPEQIDFLQAKYNMDSFHIHKYHYKGQNAGHTGFCTLKTALVYPVFEPHFRFFLRDMMRLSGCHSLIWLTGYRNKWVTHKANILAAAMVPLLPRKSESVCSLVPELRKLVSLSKNVIAFSAWFINKKLTTIPKVTIDTRIVVVGASRTAIAFLNSLLFSEASAYLTFTNVTLVSTDGLPYVRHCKPYLEIMFVRYRSHTDRFLKSTPYTYYVNVVHGTMVEINKQEKYITISTGHQYYYDKLFLLFGKQYQHPEYLRSVFEKANNESGNAPYTRLDDPTRREPQINTTYNTPDNVFIIKTMADGSKALRYVRNMWWKNFGYKVIVYGDTLHAYCCMTALLEMKVPAKNIVFVENFPPEDTRRTRIPVFCNEYVDQTVREVLDALGITVYRSYYLQSWNVDIHNMVTQINILSHFQMVELDCSVLFFYGVQGIDADAYSAIHKCGLPYDGGILIDYQFQTKDPSIYAAGPASRYCLRYFADFKQLKYYDSYEVGEALGTQIRNELDPLFTGTLASNRRTKQYSASADSTATDASSSYQKSEEDAKDFQSKTPNKEKTERLPDLVRPVVKHCMMPGGLQYLYVRSPGMKTPHHYIQSQDYNGYVMETFKSGYFKIHLTTDLIVDGITCLSSASYSIGHFKYLYGKSTVILNHVYLKYIAKKIDNFFDFFNAPALLYLYHERVEELFMMVKELLPVGQFDGDTIREALTCVSENLHESFSSEDMKIMIRSKFEKSPHVEAITSYVVEWLAENEGLLPMYFQPRRRLEFTHDISRTPMYQKRKTSASDFLKHIF